MKIYFTVGLLLAATSAWGQGSQAVRDERAFEIANTCCALLGKAAACGIDTNALAKACGRKIDELTVYGSQGRGRAVKQCVVSGELSARFQKSGGNEPCSAIREAVRGSTP